MNKKRHLHSITGGVPPVEQQRSDIPPGPDLGRTALTGSSYHTPSTTHLHNGHTNVTHVIPFFDGTTPQHPNDHDAVILPFTRRD